MFRTIHFQHSNPQLTDLAIKINPPTVEEIKAMKNKTIIAMIRPVENKALVDELVDSKVNGIALDQLLRTLSRGQAFDVSFTPPCIRLFH